MKIRRLIFTITIFSFTAISLPAFSASAVEDPRAGIQKFISGTSPVPGIPALTWSDSLALTSDTSGTWSISIQFMQGDTIQYKYIIPGGLWKKTFATASGNREINVQPNSGTYTMIIYDNWDDKPANPSNLFVVPFDGYTQLYFLPSMDTTDIIDSDVFSYEIYRSTGAVTPGVFQLVDTIAVWDTILNNGGLNPANYLTYIDSPLTNGETYFYTLVARDAYTFLASSISDSSNSDSGTPNPAIPVLFSVDIGEFLPLTAVQLSADTRLGPQFNNLLFLTDADSDGVWESDTYYLTPTTKIFYNYFFDTNYVEPTGNFAGGQRLEIVQNDGSGSFTLYDNWGETPITPVITASPDSGAVLLSWQDTYQIGVDVIGTSGGFNVYRSAVSGGSYSLVVSGIDTNFYRDTSVTNAITYYYVVRAVDSTKDNLVSDTSNEDSVTPQNNVFVGFYVDIGNISDTAVLISGTFDTPNFSIKSLTNITSSIWGGTFELKPGNIFEYKYLTSNKFTVTTYENQESLSRDVSFHYNPTSGTTAVTLVGDWLSWNLANGISMTQDPDGVFRCVAPGMSYGSHQYKFVINGTLWYTDPDNPYKSSDGSNNAIAGVNAFPTLNSSNNRELFVTTGSTEIIIAETWEDTPYAPVGFTATAVDTTTIDLSWTEITHIEDLSHYLLLRSTDPTGSYTLVMDSITIATTTYTDSNLTQGETYFYFLQSRDEEGNISDSGILAYAIPQPPVPVVFMVDVGTTITDTPVQVAGSFENPSFSGMTLSQVGSSSVWTGTAYIVPGQSFDYKYTLTQFAEPQFYEYENGNSRDYIFELPYGGGIAGGESSVVVSVFDLGINNITMNLDDDSVWRSPVSVTAGKHTYKYILNGSIYITDPNNPYLEDDGTGNINSIIYIHRFPTPSYNREDTVPQNAVSYIISDNWEDTPYPPSNFKAVPIGDSAVMVTWDAITDIEDLASYNIYMGLSPATMAEIYNTAPLYTGSYTLKLYSLNKGTSYYFRAVTVDDEGNTSSWSDLQKAIPDDPVSITFTVDAGAISPSTSLNIFGLFNNWSSSSHSLTSLGNGKWQITIDNLFKWTDFEYKYVYDSSKYEQGPYSGPNRIITIDGNPVYDNWGDTPNKPWITVSPDSGSLDLVWGYDDHDVLPPPGGFTLERALASGGPWTVLDTGIPTVSNSNVTYKDTSLTNGTVYYYQIKAVDSSDSLLTSEYSDVSYGTPAQSQDYMFTVDIGNIQTHGAPVYIRGVDAQGERSWELDWNIGRAMTQDTQFPNLWHVSIPLVPGRTLNYKYVVTTLFNKWEDPIQSYEGGDGTNRTITIASGASYFDNWQENPDDVSNVSATVTDRSVYITWDANTNDEDFSEYVIYQFTYSDSKSLTYQLTSDTTLVGALDNGSTIAIAQLVQQTTGREVRFDSLSYGTYYYYLIAAMDSADTQGQSVYLSGDFNSWSTMQNPMTEIAPGHYMTTLTLPPDQAVTYKFVINGNYFGGVAGFVKVGATFLTTSITTDGFDNAQVTLPKRQVTIVDDGTGNFYVTNVWGTYGDPVPDAPIALTPTAESGGNTVMLTWIPGPSSDVKGYYVYRSTNGSNEMVLNSVLVTDTSFVDTTTLPGYQYNYRVLSVDRQNQRSGYTETNTVITSATRIAGRYDDITVEADTGVIPYGSRISIVTLNEFYAGSIYNQSLSDNLNRILTAHAEAHRQNTVFTFLTSEVPGVSYSPTHIVEITEPGGQKWQGGSGQTVLVKIPYYDPDGDGIIYSPEGKAINVDNLKVCSIHDNKSEWEIEDGISVGGQPGYWVDKTNKKVNVRMNHFSPITLFEVAGGYSDFSNMVLYPQPYIPQESLNKFISFINLPRDVESIEIYTLSGSLVRTLERSDPSEVIEATGSNFSARWDARNEFSEEVASGIYIYMAKSGGDKKISKVAIIK